ncbi:tripartite tricarboxylate transporter TctB family protein [Aquabacter sp. L1I39]|uniref:tripartite tricarboxylate transporter TctB family protein n=1 Tax=Aquabacter sp. L1I39 TaxID=2820278 RepID=UPI001ADAD9EC|nr:tripartite tricarboxylate transporter TctB family protein [Aquabacter sp. L1I39]QTL04899.1 tripartite tricarboxylate transporter TctB family protein [Aquabacter sp. L1I39]
MSSETEKSEHTVTTRTMDVVVALLFMGVAALVMADSWRVGARWASDGPQAGYFPFYVGLIMFVASLGTLVQNLVTKTPNLTNFVDREQLGSVLKVLVPTIVYVVLIEVIGIYVASMIFIAFFMAWLGKYKWQVIAPVAVGVPLVLFVMFEIWFLVPLPKGPIETALGY